MPEKLRTLQKKRPRKYKIGDNVVARINGSDVPCSVVHIYQHGNNQTVYELRTPFGNSIKTWEYQIKPTQMGLFAMQLSKKSNWVEKSQDMYNFEQKPIGRDRKEVEGEFPKSIPNTWTEIKGVSKPQPQYLQGDTVQWGAPTGLSYSGKVEKINYSQSYQQFMYTIRGWEPNSQAWRTFTKWESDLKPAQGNLTLAKKKPWWKEHEEKYDLGSLVPDEITVDWKERKKKKKKDKEQYMKVSAGDILQFDPSKRKTPPMIHKERMDSLRADQFERRNPKTPLMNPQNQPQGEVGEEQASVYYEYDNLVINLKELFNQFKSLGEMEVAERIGRALAALENEY